MDPASLKRSANFVVAGDAAQKRSKIAGAFTNNPRVDTDVLASSRRSSFGSRSPGSPKQHTLQSAEVAADFKESLQDLQGNDRYQISNLTLIAKESTEHAMAIARVLEGHIRTTPPLRKLPALYVLDSIVKNVGTPYTIYFGQNLFKTFMDAFTLVDGQTRKAMEAMLKTWKEPIPGSMEHRPVFPVDIVRPIENALIKARTMFLQQQQEQARAQRQTHALPPRPAVVATPQPWPEASTPSPYPLPFSPPPVHQQQSQPEQKFVAPTNESQLASLFPGLVFSQQTPTPVSQVSPSPYQPPPQQQMPYIPPATPSQAQTGSQYQNTYSLVALLQAAGTYPPPPPLPPQQQDQQPQPQSQYQTIPTRQPLPSLPQSNNLFSGLDALFKYGNTPEIHNPQPFALPAPSQPSFSTPVPATASLAASTAPVLPPNIVRPPLAEVKNDVKLNATSLNVPRPSLINALYGAQPSQCATCGRRFGLDAESRTRKGRHLDAHFRTNRSIAEAARRGVSRNWYVDELDWIRSREVDDADAPPTAALGGSGANDDMGFDAGRGGAGGLGVGGDASSDTANTGNKIGVGSSRSRETYVKAPADAAVARYACPICQEEFRTVWHDGAQEWVWMDAVMVGGRPYHKSCMEELAKDRNNGVATPVSKIERAMKREI